MDAQTAHLILYCIAAVACVVWLAGLSFLLASVRKPRVDVKPDEVLRAYPNERDPANRLAIQGMAEVEGEPETLATRAASLLAKGSVGQLGPLRIIGRTDESVTFEGDAANAGIGKFIRQGAIHFARAVQNKTRIEYALDVPHGKGFLLGGMIFQALGLAAIGILFWLLNTYVADSPNPGIRAQSVQMVQVVHLLWPPFLFGGLYRQRFSSLRSTFDTFIRNLPFVEA
jgi:hypothetical protein